MRWTMMAAACALAAEAVAAQTMPAQMIPAQTGPVFSPESFKAHVAFLADDALEGRDTGSRGYRVGAAYVATRFAALGLKPGGQAGWYSEIHFRSAKLGATPASVTISGPGGTKTYANTQSVIVGPSLKEQVQDVTAPVVFVGYGIQAPGYGIDDYKGLDVRGKIVAYLPGGPDDLPSEIRAHYGDVKAATASAHGAIGTISLATEQSMKRAPWARRIEALGEPRMTWLDKSGKPDDEAPNLKVGASLDLAAGEALFAGAPKSAAQVLAEAAKKGAHPAGFALKTTVRIMRSSVWSEVASPEVIGVLPGSDPKLKDEYVVLMAHLDHLGLKSDAKPGEDAVYNGALDNAAGIATMLEAAQAFATTKEKPRRSVIFVANAGEEKGLLGAAWLAHNPPVPAASIVAGVDLDMPLLLYDFTDIVAFGAEHGTIGASIARAAATMNVKLAPDPMPEQGIFTRSDHYELVRDGIPAVMLATGFANGGAKQWQAFLAGNYHSVHDDMAQPIRWDQGARFAELNYRIARDLADADAPPAWYEGDFFGNLYGKGRPKIPRGK